MQYQLMVVDLRIWAFYTVDALFRLSKIMLKYEKILGLTLEQKDHHWISTAMGRNECNVVKCRELITKGYKDTLTVAWLRTMI